MSEELKPCPFCNGEGVIYEYSTVETCPCSMRPAQPAEAEEVGIKKFEFEIGEGGPVTEPLVRYKDHLAALSAATAERDRLQKKWARVESERDKLRAEVDGLRSDALPDGFVSAPLEPSLAMQNAGWHEIASQGIDPEAVEIGPIYRAMIAAMAAKEA